MDKASFPRCMVGAEPREPNVYPLGFTIQIFKALEKVVFSEISQTEASKSWGASIVWDDICIIIAGSLPTLQMDLLHHLTSMDEQVS